MNPENNPLNNRVHFGLVIVAICAVLLVVSEKTFVSWEGVEYWHTADDHMITQRVAYNIWSAGQPYVNVGEPVAANTSLFWPYILSLVYWVADHRTAIPVLMVVSCLIFAATIAVAALPAEDRIARNLTLLGLTFSPTALTYAATAWEHVPQAFFFTAGCVLILRRRERGGELIPTSAIALFTAAFVMRPDTAIAAAIPAAYWLLSPTRRKRASTYVWLIVFLSVLLAYLYLMQKLYGSFTPNTALLKVNPGIDSVLSGFLYLLDPMAAGMTPYIVYFLVVLWRHLRAEEKILAASMLLYSVFIGSVGGDVFPAGRFYLFLFPTAVAMITSVMLRAWPTHRRKITSTAVITIILLHAPAVVSASMRDDVLARAPSHREQLVEQIKLAQIIRSKLSPEDGSIGLHWLGVAYHMPEFHVVDFLGKAEPHIARLEPVRGPPVGHNKFDYRYAFSTYDIAAFPYEEFACDEARDYIASGTRPETTIYYILGCYEALARGDYVLLSPESLGLGGGLGLAVRNDLAHRFRE